MKKPKAKAKLPAEREKNRSIEKPPSEDILQRLSPETPPEVVELALQASAFSGPIPPPVMLREYEEIVPGAGRDIINMAKIEQQMRGKENRHVLFNDSVRVWGSLITSLALVIGGVTCVYMGSPWVGGAIATSGTIASIWRYVAIRRASHQ